MIHKSLSTLFFSSVLSFSILAQELKLETVVQSGHEAPVVSAAFSPDGKFLATGGEDQSAVLWDVESGRQIRTFSGHSKSVTALAFHPNGRTLVSGSNDQQIIYWNLETGENLGSIKLNQSITSLAFDQNGEKLAVGGRGNQSHVIDFNTKETMGSYRAIRSQYGTSVLFSEDGETLITGNDDGKVLLYDVESGKSLDTLRNISYSSCGGCPTMIQLAEGNQLFYASRHGPATLWNVESGEMTKTFGQEIERVHSIGLATDKYFVADEKSIKLFDLSGELQSEFGKDPENINKVILSPDKKSILSVNDDQTATLWSMEDGHLIRRFAGYHNRINDRGLSFSKTSYWHSHINQYIDIRNQALMSPDEKYVIQGHQDSLALLWDVNTGRVVRTLKGHEKMVISFLFTKDGRHVITASADRTIKLWDVNSGEELRTFTGHSDLVFALALSDDGKYLASGSWDGSGRLWDLATGESLNRYKFDQNSPYSLSFAYRDQYLVIAGLGKTLELIELDTGNPVRPYVGHKEIVTCVQTKNDRILTSGLDGFVKLFDIKTGFQEMKFVGHEGAVNDATFDTHGAYIATAGKDRTARLWDYKTGKEVRKFVGHDGALTSVQFFNDDRYLMTHSLDGSTKFWDLETGLELATHILFSKNDWITKTPRGYFDATNGAKENIFFVEGLNSYSLDQFFEDFYKPGILQDALTSGSDFDNEHIQEKLKSSPPPEIEIVSPKQGEKIAKDQIEVLVKITNKGGGINEIRVLHNGKRITGGDRAMFESTQRGKSIYQHIPVQLVSGKNKLSVSAFSGGRVESDIKHREILKEGPRQTITCHVVAIGIDLYKNPILNLNYAREDAEGFVDLIRKKGKSLFDEIEFYPVYDKDASKENILKTLDLVKEKAKPQDVFFFYYAGHGSTVDGNFYFIPTDNVRLYESKRLNADAIQAESIQKKLASIAALKQLVLIDACNSGSSTQVLASRGAEEEKAMAQLSRSSGVHVLAASGSEQFATEFEALGHGLFTYVLLEALAGKADGAPKDGKVTIYELKSYIDDQVPEYSLKYKGKPQFPVTYSRGQDFPVVLE